PQQVQVEGPAPQYVLSSLPGPRTKLGTPGAWVVDIEISGGLLGKTKSHITLNSEGYVTIDDSDAGFRTRVPDELSELNRLVHTLDTSSFKLTLSIPLSFCPDCYKTTLVIQRVEGAGTMRYSAIWDDTTQAKVIKPVLNIYRLASQVVRTAAKEI